MSLWFYASTAQRCARAAASDDHGQEIAWPL
jgi:hypothetical protein